MSKNPTHEYFEQPLMPIRRLHHDVYVGPPVLIWLFLLYALRHTFYLMPVIRQMLGNWSELEANPWFLPGDFVTVVLLYTWFNRIPEAGPVLRGIWRYGRSLLMFAYLWSAACLIGLNWRLIINPEHRHFDAVMVLLALDLLVIAYLVLSQQVKAVFADFPAPDQAEQLKAAAIEAVNAKRKLRESALLAAPIATDESPLVAKEAQLRQLLTTEPTNAMAWFELGVLAYQKQKPDHAMTLIRKALECDAQNPIVLRSLCELCRQQGKLVDAVRYGKEAITFAPQDEIAHLNLALAYTDIKNPIAATEHYHRVIDANPHNLQAWLNLAASLAQQKRYRDALVAVDAVLMVQPNQQQAQMLRKNIVDTNF
ncbi:tetratricopeptide repeat protein [Fluviibacter phosphoraccumulans]|uniref:tetratricopeptide repeat protein n=1 Tax=Fluviibacter phosphoraccumulans TaxID=1751046 RepID=UPI00138A1202|nr:tetratricopeptide repeat protein [Fluviibacter phosphoraccumulans]